MREFDIFINFTYSRRMKSYKSFKDFTLTTSFNVSRSLQFDANKVYYYSGICDDFTKSLDGDFRNLLDRVLSFIDLRSDTELFNLTFSDIHKIDLITTCLETIKKDLLLFETGDYFHTTGYLDFSENPESVDISLFMIEKFKDN